MSKNKASEEPKRQQPREAFGHKFATKPRPQYSEHKSGYDDSSRPKKAATAGKQEAPVGAILPPRKAEKLARVSLVERLRQRLSKEEEEK